MEFSREQTETMKIQIRTGAPDTAQHRPSRPSLANGTVIAEGTAALGHVCGSGPFWVEGTVEGGVEITGVVIVTAGGVVRGPICADTVYVAGCVEGNIFAKGLLQLEMTGDINGNITAASFLIHDGGQLNGCCTMTEAGREPVFLY